MANSEPTTGDDGADFFGGGPVRKEVFEGYDPDADAAEVLRESDLSYEGELNVLKEKGARPSRENPERYGLPSFEMGEAPEDVDTELWEESKKLPDERQHNLWRAWKFGTDDIERGDPEIRGQIYREVEGMAMEPVHAIDGAAVSEGALKTEARSLVFQGVDNFDPRKGDRVKKLSSHIYSQLWGGGNANKVKDAVGKYGDFKKPGETSKQNMGEFNDFAEEFKEQNGREPTVAEISESLGVSQGNAKKMKFELADEYDTDQAVDPAQLAADRSSDERQAIHMVYKDASNRGQVIMEHLYPEILNGTETPSGMRVNTGLNEHLADKLGVSESTITRDRQKLTDQVKDLL